MDRKLKINKEKLIKNKSVSLSQRGAFYFILFIFMLIFILNYNYFDKNKKI